MKATKDSGEDADKETKEQLTAQRKTETPGEKKNLKKIHDDFVLENFDGKNLTIDSWLDIFEKECKRCKLASDEDKILILRLFLEGTAKDWYATSLITLGIEESFDTWKSMLDNFRETGWKKCREAYKFKYIGGSLVDFAVRKQYLLLNLRKDLVIGAIIELIVTKLLIHIQDKMDRTQINTFADLVGELRKLESQVQKKKTFDQNNSPNNNQRAIRPAIQTNERKPCSYCESKGFIGRYYPETICRLKQRDTNKDSKNIKTVNNIAVQEHLNKTVTDQKN